MDRSYTDYINFSMDRSQTLHRSLDRPYIYYIDYTANWPNVKGLVVSEIFNLKNWHSHKKFPRIRKVLRITVLKIGEINTSLNKNLCIMFRKYHSKRTNFGDFNTIKTFNIFILLQSQNNSRKP